MSASGLERVARIVVTTVALVAAALPGALAADTGTGSSSAENTGFVTELAVDEPGFDSSLRIRIYYAPGFMQIPESAGHLFLVQADRSQGREAFFIPTDLALEAGEAQVYPAEFEQTSDLFGQALGGRLREGEQQQGFLLAPRLLEVEDYFPDHPESVVVRYANHRSAFRAATAAEAEAWSQAFERPLLGAGLNAWWEWIQAVDRSPELGEGEGHFLVERLFQGQGHILEREGMSVRALRNAILRVGERRLLHGPTTQRVAPRYPLAARQAGVSGLVIALCYVAADGTVGDALVLASNTAHMLNLAALSAAMDWRFRQATDSQGNRLDGWQLLPFHFQLPQAAATEPGSGVTEGVPPRIAKAVPAVYPERARQRRIEGTVVYKVTVNAGGRLVAASLEQSVHPLLDEAALEALEQYIFVPGTKDGVETGGDIFIPFTFGEEEK